MTTMSVEYEVETQDGELINCFTWAELKRYFKGVSLETLRSAHRRGSILMGKYRITKVRYEKEK